MDKEVWLPLKDTVIGSFCIDPENVERDSISEKEESIYMELEDLNAKVCLNYYVTGHLKNKKDFSTLCLVRIPKYVEVLMQVSFLPINILQMNVDKKGCVEEILILSDMESDLKYESLAGFLREIFNMPFLEDRTWFFKEGYGAFLDFIVNPLFAKDPYFFRVLVKEKFLNTCVI